MSVFGRDRSDLTMVLLFSVVIPGLLGLIIAVIVMRAWQQPEPTAAAALAPKSSVQEARQDLRAGRSDEAAKLFAALAQKGDPNAQYWLGLLDETGTGTARDVAKAITLYKAAADHDVVAAELRLGEIYLRGNLVLPDSGLAKTYLERAAAHGNARAAMLMGEFYRSGPGVLPDPVEAYAWSEVATVEGSRLAMADRDAALHMLDPQGQRAGIARARDILAAIGRHEPPE